MDRRWNYKRAFLRCALLLAVGTTLQLAFGNIPAHLLHWPWNAVLAANYLYLLVLAYSLSGRYRWLRTLWDRKSCIASLASVLALIIVYGLVRQDSSNDGPAGVLGLTSMSDSWIFTVMLAGFMTSLGIRTVAELGRAGQMAVMLRAGRITDFLHNASRTLVHVSVSVLLVAGIFGSGDKVKCRLTARLGEPVGMASDAEGNAVVLPFSVVLEKFTVDGYPPKLFVLDPADDALSGDFLSVEAEGAKADVAGWSLSADRYLDMAGCMPGDTVYRELEHVGAVPAVYVTAENLSTGERHAGWVSCGSRIFSSSSLALGSGAAVVMPPPEARQFLSRVSVTDMDGNRDVADIRVNHPARYGAWRIYQAGYDVTQGRWSTVSMLECVKDPWYFLVDAALWLMLVSGALMFLSGGVRGIRGKAGDRQGKNMKP